MTLFFCFHFGFLVGAQGLSYRIVASGRDYMMPFEHHVQILREPAVGIPKEQVRAGIEGFKRAKVEPGSKTIMLDDSHRRSNVLWVCNTCQGPLYNIAQLRSHRPP